MNRTLDRFRWAVILLVGTLFAVTVATAQGPERPVEASAAPDESGYVHWVGEFEPGSDLEHYADWVLSEVGVPADGQEERKPNGYLFTELDMVWLLLTPEEAEHANGLIGQPPLSAAGVSHQVSLIEPVDSGSYAAASGAAQRIPAGVTRIGTPVEEWNGRPPSMSGVLVAVVDTGVDARHDDLRVVDGFNCSQDERGPEGWGQDLHGHGTWIGGRIGALDNDHHVVGIAPGVAIIDSIVFDASGSASSAQVLCGLNKAIELGADVANFSLGGTHLASRCGGNDPYTNGFCKAIHGGMIVVVAAGNDGGMDAINKGPANTPGAITVGAIVDFDGMPGEQSIGYPDCGFAHRDDHLAIFSNIGSLVDVVGPGGCELSTLPGNSWGHASGTSMSTPAVVGVIANFMARYPDCRGLAATKAVLAYASRFDIDYSGWFGPDPPPLIRYVLPDREQTTNPDADPCKIPL